MDLLGSMVHCCCLTDALLLALGPRSRVERTLSAARKASVEERDTDEMACRVRQAIQRENDPLQSPELFSRNTVCLPHTVPEATTY